MFPLVNWKTGAKTKCRRESELSTDGAEAVVKCSCPLLVSVPSVRPEWSLWASGNVWLTQEHYSTTRTNTHSHTRRVKNDSGAYV